MCPFVDCESSHLLVVLTHRRDVCQVEPFSSNKRGRVLCRVE